MMSDPNDHPRDPNDHPRSLEGVPEAGRVRLDQNKQGLFTSDLTVNEFMLIRSGLSLEARSTTSACRCPTGEATRR